MTHFKQSGSSMLEALIAVVVLSVGLLGIAFLQLQSKHLNFQGIQRSSASILAHEIVEKMRNNRAALSDYLGTYGGGSLTTEPADCVFGSPCTHQQLAARDLWLWEQSLDGAEELAGTVSTGGLSEPTACIAGPGGGGTGTYTVSIVWRGQSTQSDVNADTCGQSSGKYDDSPGDSAYRRVLALDVYINDA
jgi:type IV pilus assembly protein PilV